MVQLLPTLFKPRMRGWNHASIASERAPRTSVGLQHYSSPCSHAVQVVCKGAVLQGPWRRGGVSRVACRSRAKRRRKWRRRAWGGAAGGTPLGSDQITVTGRLMIRSAGSHTIYTVLNPDMRRLLEVILAGSGFQSRPSPLHRC